MAYGIAHRHGTARRRAGGARASLGLPLLFLAALHAPAGAQATAPIVSSEDPEAATPPAPVGTSYAPAIATPAATQLTPLEVNREMLVEMAVLGAIAAPRQANPPYRIAPDGTIKTLPGTGSITYNFRVGDSAVRLAGDHVEPAVSITTWPEGEQRGLNVLAQVGNQARVVSGDARGALGTVIGKHGGIENVMVEFPDEVYDHLVIGDRIQIRAVGLGMVARNVEGVAIRNLSPRLLDALNANGMGVMPEGKLRVPVTHTIPAKIMGSGLGRSHVASGDYDIQMFDAGAVEEHGLDRLRFGDIVAILDADNTHGRIWKEGAMTIGVVAHGISRVAGHGPGVTTLLTSATGNIEPVIDPGMNLARLLELRPGVIGR